MTDAPDTTVTDEAIQDFLEGSAPSFHTLLQVWCEVLKPAAQERTKKITPQWANRIVNTYSGISFADVPDFRDQYFSKIMELAAILDAEIESDDECLKHTTVEEDREHNSVHYLNVLINWQLAFLQWELDWEVESDTAATELAAISEVHKMFFDQTGLIGLLDQINFEFTDADREILSQAMQDLKDSQEG